MKLLTYATLGFNVVAILLLSIALSGNPPYSFFSTMKAAVAAAVVASVIALVRINASYAALAAVLAYLGYTELFAKMRRQEWAPYNVATILLLLISSVLISKWIAQSRTSGEGRPA